jgi:hypothetical protein
MRSLDLNDRLLAHALAAVTLAYLASLPRYLGWADESYFLYEAKRIRDGEVMYRDIFQFITPLASYLMAFLYWVFGTTIATARLAMAAAHATLCGLLFATCRALGVRRVLALLAPLAFLSLCQPVWPFASPHWFSTTMTMGVLSLLIFVEPRMRANVTFIIGIALGLLIGVQQQKGLIITAGVGVIFLCHQLVGRHHARGGPRLLATRLAYLLAGVLTIVLPLGLWMIATAGIGPLYDALVVFPLESYRHGHYIRWGATAPLADSFSAATFPTLLRWSPALLVLPLARLLYVIARADDETTARSLATLVIFGAASVCSIWYFPDLIHIAFIAPIFLVCAAESLEWLLRCVRPPIFAAALGAAVAVILAGGLTLQLGRNTAEMRRQFTIPHATAFGRIDFARAWEPMFVDGVRAALDHVAGRELFSYPNVTSIYLTAGAHNPTPFQYLLASVSPPAQIAEAQRILEERQLPYVVVAPMIFTARDPLSKFITAHYESAPIQAIVDAGELPSFWLYRRKTAPDE